MISDKLDFTEIFKEGNGRSAKLAILNIVKTPEEAQRYF